MIEIDNVEISLGRDKILKTESFEITFGLWALIGRNGSGKSSFLNAILQSKSITNGAISLLGQPISNHTSKTLAEMISVVYTKPAVFGNFTVKEVVELGRIPFGNAFGLLKQGDYVICEKAISELKIEHLVNQQFNILSDGEKQLVMIARALAQNTPIIILDEPTAFLDVVNRAEIIKLLKRVVINQNKMILFSTHDVALIPELCDGLLWIDKEELKGSIVKDEFKTIIDQIF